MTMKRLFHDPILRLTVGALLLVSVAACSKRSEADGKDRNIDYWTCTMHPSVHSKDPGKCPICSMDLVPVMKSFISIFLFTRNCRIVSAPPGTLPWPTWLHMKWDIIYRNY